MISGISQASQMASQLFAKLDTKSQGYIEKSDLSSAFSQISSNSSSSASSASVDDVFSALDSNSDGKVTKDEFSTVLSKLQEQLQSQLGQSQMQGSGGPQGMGGRPLPPPADADAGSFTKDELISKLSETSSSSNSQQTDLMSKIVSNFEAADSDGDGKVSAKEAMAYDQSTQNSSTSTTSSSSANNSDAQVMMKIMQLMHAYGSQQSQSAFSSQLSVSA